MVPVLILFGWLIFSSGIRRAAVFLGGAAIGCTLVCLPFFVLAPSQMWRMVVIDQVQRNNGGLRSVERMNQILGLTLYNPPPRLTVALVVCGAFDGGRHHCRLDSVARPTGGAADAGAGRHADGHAVLVPALHSVDRRADRHHHRCGGAADGELGSAPGAGGRSSWVLRAPSFSACWLLRPPSLPPELASGFRVVPSAAAMAPRPGCITTDNASTLILTNTLSRNLDRGCQLVADLGGASYHLDSPARGVVSRQKNAVFQQYALAYLRTGQTTILVRFRRGFGLSSSSYDIVQHWPVVARAGRYVLRAPRP